MSGPYRDAGAESCPACKTTMLSGDRMESRRCPSGCGEWCDASMVEKQWGDCVDIDGDPRLAWRHSKDKIPCIQCAAPMSRVINSAWIAHRCRAHGVWFVKDGRRHFERVHADDIKRYVAIQARVSDVAKELQEVVAHNPIATRAVAARIITLELAVDSLTAELQRLHELIRRA